MTIATKEAPSAEVARIVYLAHLWEELRKDFNLDLPERVVITCGWTSRNARGPVGRRLPADVVTGEWQGDPTAEAFVSIHPERFHTAEEVEMALLYAMGRAAHGKRRGHEKVGVYRDPESGEMKYMPSEAGERANALLSRVNSRLGKLPEGFAVVPPPKHIERTRLRKWVCTKCTLIVRAASDHLDLVHGKHGRLVLAPTNEEKKKLAA